MLLGEVYGMGPAVRAFRTALATGHIPGAYLVIGPPGIGKSAVAIAFAGALACLSPRQDPADACGSCASCRMIGAGTHPEISLIAPSGDTTQIWQFWDREGRPAGVLQKAAQYAPAIGRKRVFIIQRADTLTEGAANSLLKILEEPPPFVQFILLTPNAGKVLPTIQSRCQAVRVHAPSVSDLSGYLQATGVEQERALALASYAQGRTGTALRMLRSETAEVELQKAVSLAESIAGTSYLGALRLAENLRKLAVSLKSLGAEDDPSSAPRNGDEAAISESPARTDRASRRQTSELLDVLALYYRDVLGLILDPESTQLVYRHARPGMAPLVSRLSAETCIDCIELIAEARKLVDQNVSLGILTDALVLKLVAAAAPTSQ